MLNRATFSSSVPDTLFLIKLILCLSWSGKKFVDVEDVDTYNWCKEYILINKIGYSPHEINCSLLVAL